jgi:hypothetical protein
MSTRALKAARAAGIKVGSYAVDQGRSKIIIHAADEARGGKPLRSMEVIRPWSGLTSKAGSVLHLQVPWHVARSEAESLLPSLWS